MSRETEVRTAVRRYYGKLAQGERSDCCTPGTPRAEGGGEADRSACGCSAPAAPARASQRGLSCGDPVSPAKLKTGETVVDLGAGPGADCFLAAEKVGSAGRVIGVDMTPEMIERARREAEKGGYAQVEFRLGEIENLPVADASADVVISNCVINLSPDKPRVFREAFRVLKPGGRLVVADIVALAPIPAAARGDLALWAGCVAGSETREILEEMLRAAGFSQVRIEVGEPEGAQAGPGDCGCGCGDAAERISVAAAHISARKPAAG